MSQAFLISSGFSSIFLMIEIVLKVSNFELYTINKGKLEEIGIRDSTS